MLDDYLVRVAVADAATRRANLQTILTEIEAPVQHQRAAGIDNIVVSFHDDTQPYILIGAYYDAVADSDGANRNAAAVAVALGILRVFTFIQNRRDRPLPLEFVFFDHHADQRGSRLYADQTETDRIYTALDLNLCGIGDTVILAVGSYARHSPLDRALRRLELSPHTQGLRIVDLLPPGDIQPFAEQDVPAVSLCIVPEDDILPFVGVGLAQQVGEQVALLPGIYASIHDPAQDTVETIDIDSMRQVMLIVNHLVSNLLKTMPEEDIDWK